MNKTININLGGVFFHIDEDAYSKLKKYLEAIRKSLSDDPQGKDEIITDIEIRIGEILSEKVKDVRQVINEQDIEGIIDVMGRPEQYAGDEEFFDDESFSSSNKKGSNRKLFRDSDDKFLGGVSSGLAHYFNIDVIWIRLLWLLLMYKGTGLILYVILWILLPETKSTTDKLEMEGEDVTISSIERKIKEGFSDASQLLKDGIDDVSTQVKNGKYQSKVKTGLQEIIDLFSKVFSAIFKVTGKFIGVLLIAVSVATLFGILAGGFSLGSAEFLGLSKELVSYPPFFYTSRIPKWLLTSFVFIVIAIPFVFLFKMGLKIISSNVKRFSRATNLSLLGLWLLAIMSLSFAGIEYGAHSANKFWKSESFTIDHLSTKDTLTIKMIALDGFDTYRYHDEKTIFINETETSYKTNISLDVRESDSSEIYLKWNKKAKGISVKKAKELTSDIRYKFEVVNNTLLLDAYFLSDMSYLYDSQSVRITLYIPKGMTIYLDKSTKGFLSEVDNVQDLYDRRMIKHHFKMIDEGLDCLDCEDSKSSKKEQRKAKTETIKSTVIDKKTNQIKDNVVKPKTTPSDDAEEINRKAKEKINNIKKEA